MRRRRGVALPREAGLVAGAARCSSRCFSISWPLMVAGIALALQLQTSRIFWMLDFLAAIYIAWLLAEAPRVARRAARDVAALVAIAVGRGVYVWRVEHAGNPVARVGFPQDNWTDAMKWISRTPDRYARAGRSRSCLEVRHQRAGGRRARRLSRRSQGPRAGVVFARGRGRGAAAHSATRRHSIRSRPLSCGRSRRDTISITSSADRDLDLPVAYRNEQFRIMTRSSDPAIRSGTHDNMPISFRSPMEGGPLDDFVRVGQAAQLPHAAPASASLLRRRAGHAACSRTATGSRAPWEHPTLIALHGLESSSDAHYVRGLADKALRPASTPSA